MSRAGRIAFKAAKIIAGVVVALVVAIAVLLAVYCQEARNIQDLPASFEAKAMCSCLFVQGRSQEFCVDFARQDTVPVDSREVDADGKSVKVHALWTTHTARYVSDRYGCILEPEQ